MAVLNSRHNAPFLTYLTVFKARLGTVNSILDLTGFGFTPPETLTRKLTGVFSERDPLSLDDKENDKVFSYLVEKRLVGSEHPRKSGRYQDFALTHKQKWVAAGRDGQPLSAVPVYLTDLWFADPRLPSTVGVPTPDNADEVIELSRQLGLLTRTKNSWTAAGQLVAGLRNNPCNERQKDTNPILLGLEAAALLRQILAVDGLIIRHLLALLMGVQTTTLRRDTVALMLPQVAANALDDARRLRKAPSEIAAGKSFVELLRTTATKRGSQSGAPGVLEHRTSPRLEWLTDLGVLQKRGLAKNGFEYSLSRDASILNTELSKPPEADYWAENASLSYTRASSFFKSIRKETALVDLSASLLEGYRVMQRSVGPASIKDVAFAACVMCDDADISYPDMIRQLIDWSSHTDGVTVSGGRYSRGPELIHVAPKALSE